MKPDEIEQQVKREQQIHFFYKLALSEYQDGGTIEDLEEAIEYWRDEEKYEACAGILMAIKYIKITKK